MVLRKYMSLEALGLTKGDWVGVVGFGLSGRSASSILNELGCKVFVFDKMGRENFNEDEIREYSERGITLYFGDHYPELLKKMKLIVVSPGVDLKLPEFQMLYQSGKDILSELEVGWRLSESEFIAITGSNGKSTTTVWLGHTIFYSNKRAEIIGNIGVPVTKVVKRLTRSTIAVVEVSSFQLLSCEKFRPDIGVILNISPDHLDRHSDLEEYVTAKFKLFSNNTGSEYAFLNYDDPIIRKRSTTIKGKIIFFSSTKKLDKGIYFNGSEIRTNIEGYERLVIPTEGIKLIGIHNIENAMVVVGISQILGLSREEILSGLNTFEGLPHRLEYVGEYRGVKFINDSKATNPASTASALKSISEQIILIAGGQTKGADFHELKELIANKVKALCLIGESKEYLKEVFDSCCPIELCQSMEEAIWKAFKFSKAGDVILLSPGCASFDMFKNYKERGEVFKNNVFKLFNKLKK